MDKKFWESLQDFPEEMIILAETWRTNKSQAKWEQEECSRLKDKYNKAWSKEKE